jgi:hypothetical protein
MALGERFRSGGAHGIARFLAEHQDCGSGFDVRRGEGAGSGRLRITCEGCGATVDYKAAEAGELAAGGLPTTTIPDNGEPPGPDAPPVAVARPTGGGVPPPPVVRRARATPRPQPRGGRIPSWIPVALISALILGGLAMIAIGLSRDDEEPPASQPSGGQEAAPAAPSGGGQKATPAPADQDEAQAPESPESAETPENGAGVSLDRRTFANRFAIGVPTGWDDRVEGGGISLTAPGATAEIAVFFEEGGMPLTQLASATRGFLAERHQGAQVAAPRPVRVGPHRALRIEATYQGGEEIAVVISANGFSHVVLRRVDRGASPDLEQQAEASLASFRPR